MYFSIIIPVYKVEDYLSKCVDSVLQQTERNFEIILVNDGSPDKCPVLCDDYAISHANIIVVHQPNQGSSVARNTGLSKASGDYIIFMDSDDYWESPDILEKIKTASLEKTADVVLFGCKDCETNTGLKKESKGTYDLSVFNSKNKNNILKYLMDSHKFPGAAWLLATKRNMLLDHKIDFKVQNKAEDVDWLVNVFFHARKLQAVNDVYYIYLKNRPGSITSKVDRNSINGILYALDRWKEKCKIDASAVQLLRFLNYEYTIALMLSCKIEDYRETLHFLKKHKDILNYPFNFKTTIIGYSIKLLGLKNTANVLQMFFQMHLRM
jgi:glycosyltransferase involved in cell wall biosynthesis